jgi:molecular chaperone GrpE (heat shock protein)
MSNHTHREEEEEREAARHVKVTDKRRVHHTDGPAEPNDQPGERDLAAPDTQGQPAPVVGVAGPAGWREELEAARKQAAEYLEHLQRLKAEFDNYRKRVLKEQTRAVEMASEPLLRRLLEVLDEFDLALMAAEQKPDFDRFLHGVELVYAKLQEILRSEGLERIDAKGKPFDPEQHEALMQSGDGDGEPRVADVLRTGYSLRGRVIRPAGVKVVRK